MMDNGWMLMRVGFSLAVRITSFCCLCLVGSAAARAEISNTGVTSLAFEQSVLDALGIAVQARSTATPYEPGQIGFAIEPDSDLAFDAPGGDFEGFSGGALRHSGELILHFGGAAHVLSDFELRVARWLSASWRWDPAPGFSSS